MQAELFYTTHHHQVIPLFLISQSQWESGIEHLSAAERNSFALCQFTGGLGQSCLISNADGLIQKAYVGSGSNNQELALAHAALILPPACYEAQEDLTQKAFLNWGLAQYRFTRYKKQDLHPRILLIQEEKKADLLKLLQAIYLVRDLVNMPPNDLGPKELAAILEQMAHQNQAQFKQWVGKELLEHHFPAIHAVGRASASEPRLLSLTWGKPEDPHIVLIGKGVCFDSGGLDLKPSSNMRLMKKDMGGAAHVLGLAQWLMQKQLPVYLEVLIPAVENAVGPASFRPGDILSMRNGLTVEIDNTDAEGRLILADALVKACESEPELIIDFATLTGAARVALGTGIAALCSNHDEIAEKLYQISLQTSDPVWRLPLHSSYEDLLASSIADLLNASPTPYAGAITAGLFLQRFIKSSIPWVHFDVMAWNPSAKPGKPEGGEAMGFYTVAEYLLQTYGKSKTEGR